MSLTEIKQQFISRIAYSTRLLTFIDKMEQKNISIEDAHRFCIDILGKKSSQPLEVFLLLKPLLKEQVETYQKMADLCDETTFSVAIAKVDLSLENQMCTNQKIIQTFGAISADSLKWVHVLSEEQVFFESLRRELKPHLPAPYQFFKKYFSISLYNTDYNKFDKQKRQKVNYVISLNFDEGLCYEFATEYVFKSSNESIKKRLHLLSAEAHQECLGNIADEISAVILEKNKLVEKYIEQVKLNVMINNDWILALIGDAFKFYQALGNIKNEVVTIYQKMESLANQEERSLNLFAQIKAIKLKIDKHAEQCKDQQKKWHVYIQDDPKLTHISLEEIAKRIAISQKVLAIYFGELTKAIDLIMSEENMPSVQEISQFGVFCEKKLGEIKKIINQYAQYILEHKRQSEYLSNQKLIEETLQSKEEKQSYINQKQQCTFLWNVKVEEQRQAKEQAKLNARTNGAKPIDQLALQQKEKNEELMLLQIVECLKHLSAHYIDLIKSIFCVEKGIFYHEVYYLITNQLNGKIIEHGSGSSHKTIILNNFSTCFITSGQLPATIKGGMYKPHGKAHQSGELCGFNLELIQEALIKAKITPEVIELLEQIKLKESFSKMSL